MCLRQRGFSLVELVTIMVIIGVLASVSVTKMMPNAIIQLQGARDLVVSALYVAQQQALAQTNPVRVSFASGAVDVRIDDDRDGVFSASESLRFAGVQYPLALPGKVSVSHITLDYDRLGRTSDSNISLSKGGASVTVAVSEAGYAR